MVGITDIQQKYIRLIEIYADKNLDNSGAEAQNLITELTAVGNEDYKNAVKLAKSKLNPTQKFYAATAERAIAAARKAAPTTQTTQATVAQPQPAPAPQPQPAPAPQPQPAQATQTTVAPTQPSVTPPKAPQPSAPKNHNKPQTSVQPTAPKPARQSRDLPKEVAEDLNKYIYGDDLFYSDAIADYMEADGLSSREKISHNLNVIDHVWNEYKKRPATPNAKHIDRQKLLAIGLSIGYSIQDDKVHAKLQKFLSFMSGKAQKYYLRKGKDYFLDDLQVAHSKVAPKVDDTAYIDKISSKHVTGIFDVLKTDEDKLKYLKLLRKRKFLQYVPQELQNNLTELEKQSKDAPKKQPQGDKKMTELTDEQKKQLAKYKSVAQLTGLDLNTVTAEDYNATMEALKAAKRNFWASYDKPEDQEDTKKTKEGEDTEDKKKTKDDNTEKKPLNVGVLSKTPEPVKEEQPEEPKDWVARKIAAYKEMALAGKIADFDYDKENKTEFKAWFNGATVHYTSEDNVKVSENANVSVFETIINEPDNKNRTINFSENMPHLTAMHLKAACLLNGRAMTGTLPEFTAEDMQILSQELGPERFAQLNKIINPQREAEQPTQETPTAEKASISTTEELSKAAADIQKIKDDFNKMKEDGLIAVSTNLETKKPEIVAGPALEGKTEEEKQATVDAANALIASAAAIVQSSKTVSGKLNDEQQKANNDFNATRLEHIRQNMDHKKLEEKADHVALIHAKRMGLVDVEVKDNKGNEVKTIENDAQRKAYSEERNKNPELSARIAKVVQQNQASK